MENGRFKERHSCDGFDVANGEEVPDASRKDLRHCDRIDPGSRIENVLQENSFHSLARMGSEVTGLLTLR